MVAVTAGGHIDIGAQTSERLVLAEHHGAGCIDRGADLDGRKRPGRIGQDVHLSGLDVGEVPHGRIDLSPNADRDEEHGEEGDQ